MQSFPNDVLTDIRKYLEDQKTDVASKIRQLTQQDPFSDPDRTNDNAASDREASEESDHDRYAAQIAALKLKLTEIDEALSRIASGTYGFCTKCSQMIDTDRLSILPMATLCLSCEKAKNPPAGGGRAQ